MLKRKHEGDAAGEHVDAKRDIRQKRRIVYAFTQSVQQISQAFKLARAFERQKMGRRRKEAESQKDYRGMRRIDEEIAALKSLDFESTARQHLSKHLLKIKAVAADPDVPVEIKATPPPASDAATLNVIARMCNSNPVKKVFPGAIREVKKELGVELDPQEPTKKKRLRAKDFQNDNAETDEVAVRTRTKHTARGSTLADDISESGNDSEFEGFEESEDEELNGVMQKYQGRIASSDDEDLGEVSDIEDLERRLEAEGISKGHIPQSRQKYDLAADLSLSDAQSEAESEAESLAPEPRKVLTLKKSAFVPSLTLGGYVSGSGSDIEDELDVAKRKNRRGQRARQQIWEKKYGVKATHLQKPDRNQGWDPKRGATERGGRGARGGIQRGRGRGGTASSHRVGGRRDESKAGASALAKPRRDDSGPLHPSWEAAKKAKEKKSIPVAFQGKKISFD